MSRIRSVALYILYAIPLCLAVGRAPADIALSIIALLFLGQSMYARRFEWLKQNDIRILLLLVTYLCVQSFVVSDQPRLSFYIGFSWLRFPLFYAAIGFWLLTDDAVRTRLANITLLTISLVVVDTFWQYFTGSSLTGNPILGGRLTGPLSTPNVGNYLLKLSIPALGILVAQGHRRVAFAALFFIMLLIPLTGERGSTLLMLLAIVTCAGVAVWFRPALRSMVWKVMLLVVIGGALVSTQEVVQHRAEFMMQQLDNFSSTEYGQIYAAAYHMWRENPLLGVGISQFHSNCVPLVVDGVVPMCTACGDKICNQHAHNIFLQFLSETGLIGAMLFILFSGCCLHRIWMNIPDNHESLIPFSVMAVSVAVLFFPFINAQNPFSNWPAVLFWFTLGFAMSFTQPKKNA